MSYLRIIPAALIASVLFFHFPHILGVIQIGDMTVPTTPQVPAGPTPPPSLRDLYVSENLDGGAKLQLSNGDIYEIHPDDRDVSSTWLLPSNVTVTPSKNLDYPIIITNTISGTSIKAKKFDPSAPLPSQALPQAPNQKKPGTPQKQP